MSRVSSKDVAKAINLEIENKSGEELQRVLDNSVEFLVRKNLLGKAEDILNYLSQIYDSKEGVVRAKVRSGRQVTDLQKMELKEMLKGRYKVKDVIVEFIDDKSLLGGLRIEGNDEVIDLTHKNKINKLRNYLLEYSTQN